MGNNRFHSRYFHGHDCDMIVVVELMDRNMHRSTRIALLLCTKTKNSRMQINENSERKERRGDEKMIVEME